MKYYITCAMAGMVMHDNLTRKGGYEWVPLKFQVEINSDSEFQSHCLFMFFRIDPGKAIRGKFLPINHR